MHAINIRDHRVVLLTQTGSLRTMSYYGFPDCFVKNITHTSSRPLKWEHPSKRRRMMHLSFSIHSLYSWRCLCYWLRATSQKVIFHLATSPVLQSACWQINPVGLLGVLCPQMARWCWWGSLLYWRGGGGVLTEWVIVTLSGLKCQAEMWGMDEPVPWQQKQREGSIAKTPKATAHALFLDFPYHQ